MLRRAAAALLVAATASSLSVPIRVRPGRHLRSLRAGSAAATAARGTVGTRHRAAALVRSVPAPRPALAAALGAAALLTVPRPAAAAATPAAAAAALRYTSIPVIAGLLNWATNKLAIQMMFRPLRFVGLFGTLGWQGIVPRKAVSMANRIVDDVVLRLIDLKTVFARLPPAAVASALAPMVLSVAAGLAADLAERSPGLGGAAVAGAAGTAAFSSAAAAQGRAVVEGLVGDVQADPESVFDLRAVVVDALSDDPRSLVSLFERCGENDLRFVVKSGLWLGGALGVLQAAVYARWSPFYSLAVTGALVGMVTDQVSSCCRRRAAVLTPSPPLLPARPQGHLRAGRAA